MFKQFKKLFITIDDVSDSTDLLRIINQLQGNIENSLTPLVTKIQNDSTILTNVSLSASSTNVVNHTLNRKLSGWQVIRQRAQSQIWDDQDNNTSPNLTLLLNVSNDVVVDLLVW